MVLVPASGLALTVHEVPLVPFVPSEPFRTTTDVPSEQAMVDVPSPLSLTLHGCPVGPGHAWSAPHARPRSAAREMAWCSRRFMIAPLILDTCLNPGTARPSP